MSERERAIDGGRHGRLFVLSGPSGVGKSTVLAQVRSLVPGLWYSVSATTRARRPGEVDGVNYHFVTEERFRELIDGGRLLEHAHFAGNWYGTPRDAVEERLAAGEDVLLEIEVQGARQVRAAPGLGRFAEDRTDVTGFTGTRVEVRGPQHRGELQHGFFTGKK